MEDSDNNLAIKQMAATALEQCKNTDTIELVYKLLTSLT